MIRRRARGFTLLELVIALGMVSVLAGLAYSSLRQTSRLVEYRERQARTLHRGSFILRHLADHLQNVYLDSGAFDRPDAAGMLFEGGADQIIFWTHMPPPTRRRAQQGGLQRVEYSLGLAEEQDADLDAEPRSALQCRIYPELWDLAGEPAAQWSLPVDDIQFEYSDGETWAGGWDVEDAERLPRAVRVTLRVPSGGSEPLELTTTIPLHVTHEVDVDEPEDGGGEEEATAGPAAADAETESPGTNANAAGVSGGDTPFSQGR